MKEYALISDRYVRIVNLRETDKFLINDANGCKYKKYNNEEYVASNLKFSDWAWHGDNVYEIDHPIVSETREKIRKANFLTSIKIKLKEYKIESYEDAERIRDFFNFDV